MSQTPIRCVRCTGESHDRGHRHECIRCWRARTGGVPSPQTLAITSVHVVDVAATDPSRAVNPDQTVIVRDGRIIALGNSKLIGVPAEAQRVSGAGKYLIPGLWDMHAHLLGANKRDSFLPLYVVNGVTSVRDMHTVMPMHEVNRWRQDIAAGADPASCRRRCRPADCRSERLSVWASHRNLTPMRVERCLRASGWASTS